MAGETMTVDGLETRVLFEKTYDEESLYDLERDVAEAVEDINGGTFKVIITWFSDPETGHASLHGDAMWLGVPRHRRASSTPDDCSEHYRPSASHAR